MALSTKKDRDKYFRPVHVRERLEKLKFPVMIDNDRYSKLCELAVHVTPSIRPNGHNLLGIPSSGGYGQDEGVLIVLNELAIATSHAGFPLPTLLQYEAERSKEILSACRDLLLAVGGADIKGIEEYRSKVFDDLHAELVKKRVRPNRPVNSEAGHPTIAFGPIV